MSTDDMLTTLPQIDWRWAYMAAGVVAALAGLALLGRRIGRRNLAGRLTALATLLGLGWSAQGMWDTAVRHYHQDRIVAWVLFFVFEAMLCARMLKAHQYRTDLYRRARHARAVWLIAVIMALVVALGEGWAQAPARLAIPLLVAYGWWTDLTADDDPGAKLSTSWRLTPRRIGLALRLLEPGERDAQTIDRDNLRDRMTRLAFRAEHAPAWLNDALHRPARLARLKTMADDADLFNVRTRLARMSVNLMEPPPAPERPSKLILPPHRRAEMSDRMAVMLASMTADRPKGMTATELAATLGVSLRTAETIAAEARKVNGRPMS